MGSEAHTLLGWLDDLRAAAGGGAAPARDPAAGPPSWSELAAHCDAAAEAAGGAAPLLAAMQALASERFSAEAEGLPGSFNDQRQLYWGAARWLLPELASDLRARFEELPEGPLRFTLEGPAQGLPCPLFFELICCALVETPLLVRHPAARVEQAPTPLGALYTIHPSTIAKRDFQGHYDAMLGVSGKLAYEWEIATGVISIRGESDDVGFAVGGGGVDRSALLADVSSEDRRRFSIELERAMAARDQFHLEYTHHPKGKAPIVVENVGYFLMDEGGAPTKMLGFAWNVTEEREKQSEQRAYRDMLDRIASASPEILYLFDLGTWSMLYINDAVEEVLGFDSEDILRDPASFAERIHPDDRGVFENYQETVRTLANEGVVDLAFRVLNAADEWVWIKLRNRVVSRSPDGDVREVLGAATDITEYQRAQEERAISQERYRIVSELTSDYSFSVRVDRDGSMKREWITEAFANITGYRPEELSESQWEQLVHPDDAEARRAQFARVIDTGYGIQEFRILRKSGETRVIREHSRVIRNDDGSLHWYGACRDITEQKLAESARALVEERFDAITQSSRDVIVEFDESGESVYVSPNVRALLGHEPHEVTERHRHDLIHPDDIDMVQQRLSQLMARGGSDDLIFRMGNASGEWRWMDTTVTTFRTTGNRTRLVMVSRDITDRLEIEGERRRLVSIVESSSELIAMFGADGRLLFLNDAGQRMLGIASAGEVRGRAVFDCLAPEDAQDLRFQVLPTVEQRGHWEGEIRFRHLGSGVHLSTLAHVFVVAGRGRDQERVVAIVARDVSERILAERMLRESEARHRMLVESAYDLIAEIDADGRYVYASPNFRDQLGHPPEHLLGRSWYRQVHEEDRDEARRAVRELLAGRAHTSPPLRIRHADGGFRSVEANLKRYENIHGDSLVLAFFRDITRRLEAEEALRRSQEDLLQSQKMEAIGRLAGGVAHDFNNLLTAITGYCDLLLEEIGEREQMRADAEEIIRAAERAATLTRQLLAFSRRQVLSPKVIDLNALVSDVERLLRRLIGEHIELVSVLERELSNVRLDPGQLEQLVINLAVNARDAMPRGGRLSIETANLEIPPAGDPAHPGIAPGLYVTLSVSDTGVGIEPATLSKIFEPFFSTKESGKGTGLGLATVYGIIQQSGGEVRVESELGAGSTFTVYLPQVDEAAPEPEPVAVHESLRGGETLLLVEDASTVRKLVRRYLENHGYQVLDAESGVEALALAAEHAGRIDLLVTDVVLPKIDGHELAKRLQQTRPETRVLYMSGFSDDALARHGLELRDITLIQKPFTQRALLREVRRILGEPPPVDGAAAATDAAIPPRSEMH